ncbi:MAG TPA: PhzF family phenazine biosynthesis protein [Xanthobacteraceae bacterium]|nr:PhzF family phenazine biosynthesis protein [Xanthobacteraceae bacterium]
MRRRFVTLDVFTDTRFAGNPLAVVLDAEGLDDAAMQAVAREFNLSETVFVLPPEEAAHRARLRIFTPASELPFAGHPTVGAAVLLGRLDALEEETEMMLEENVGPVRCMVRPARHGGAGHARFDLPRLPQRVGDAADASVVAAALGLSPGDIGCAGFTLGRWSAGIEFTMVPVRDRGTIARARADLARWPQAFGGSGQGAAFLFCREVVDARHFLHARMFAPAMGVAEDPATGSAVAALSGVIAREGGLADGVHALAIEQGYEMGRPSVVHLGLVLARGGVAAASIGGDAVLVSEGEIEA